MLFQQIRWKTKVDYSDCVGLLEKSCVGYADWCGILTPQPPSPKKEGGGGQETRCLLPLP